MEPLFAAVRAACPAPTWSRGVELTRAAAVVGVRERDGEVELRVTPPGTTVAINVFLYPDDEDWSCDCKSQDDACAHVAAAVISLRQARQSGRSLPGMGATAPRQVAYRLSRRGDRLALARALVSSTAGEAEAALDGTLAQLAAAVPPRAVATGTDLEIERLVERWGEGPIARDAMARLLALLGEALTDGSDVRLDGEPAKVGDGTTGMRAVVEDCEVGFRVRLEQDPAVSELFANGAVRTGPLLRPLLPPRLGERELGELRRGKLFGPDAVGVLVSELLPRLEAAVPVQLDARRLPGRSTARPRLQVTTRRIGDELEILAHVVYGEPAVARLDGDHLTALGRGDLPVRDERREQRLLRLLSAELGLEPGVRRTLPAAEAIAWTARLTTQAPGLQPQGDFEQFYDAGELVPELDATDLELWFEGEQDGEQRGGPGSGRADPAAVLAAWERGDELAPLLGGGFGRVPAQWLLAHADRVRGLVAGRGEGAGEGRAGLAPWALADYAALCASLNQTAPPALAKAREALAAAAQGGDPWSGDPALPDDLNAELRTYQRAGASWLALLGGAGLGALLADDMGLGKTLQTLVAMRGRTLVVAPTSVLSNWLAEAARFRPKLRARAYHGPDRRLDPEAELTVTSYALLRLDAEQLAAQTWDTVVLDESQTIKNPTSQVARAAYALRAARRIALTGTPVENRLEDLWSQMHFLNPGMLGGRDDFHRQVARPIAAGDADAAERLRARIRPFVLRRLKRQVATELPPRTEITLWCELQPAEREAYDAVRAATRADVLARLDAGGPGNVMQILEALLRLRQAACHAALLPGYEDRAGTASAKTETLLTQLDEAVAEGHKALVFSQWTSLLDQLEPQLRAAGLPFTRLDGSTKDRAAVVAQFSEPAGPPVLLISLKAGGTGLNLTAADHVFLLDPWWNPAVEDQAADRAHRLGQERPVFVHRIVAKDTVEERILALQARKRELFALAVEGGAQAAAGVTRDELLALLAD